MSEKNFRQDLVVEGRGKKTLRALPDREDKAYELHQGEARQRDAPQPGATERRIAGIVDKETVDGCRWSHAALQSLIDAHTRCRADRAVETDNDPKMGAGHS